MSWQNIIFIVFGLWLIVLTGFLVSWLLFWHRLSKGVKEKDLRKLLDSLLALGNKNTEGIEKLQKLVDQLGEEGFSHIQKVGLVRFNPFKELGGDHSFSLAVLDGRDTGIIITGLHTRERTRIYAKAVKSGRSEFELSEEEKKAFVKAQKS